MMSPNLQRGAYRDEDATIPTSRPVEGLYAAETRAIRIALDPLPDSPRRRELRGRLETYERVIDSRRKVDVTQAQRWALLELLVELRDDAAALGAAADASRSSGDDAPVSARRSYPGAR